MEKKAGREQLELVLAGIQNRLTFPATADHVVREIVGGLGRYLIASGIEPSVTDEMSLAGLLPEARRRIAISWERRMEEASEDRTTFAGRPILQRFEEDLAKAILRDGLRAFGISDDGAFDIVKRLPNDYERTKRISHLADFAIERLSFGDGKTARTRSTTAELYQAYRSWLASANPVIKPLTVTAFARELNKSITVSRRTASGAGGNRSRGWRGVGLKPPPSEPPGQYAKQVTAAFNAQTEGKEFPEAVIRERERLRKSRN